MKSFSGLLALTFGLTVCACGHIRAGSLPRSTTAEHTQAVAAAPRIIALPPPLVRVGDAFSYQIACDQANVAFSATGLPTGLSVDVATGLITGSPQVAGSFAVTLGVANAHGSSSSPLTLFIRPALPTVSLVAALLGFALQWLQVGTGPLLWKARFGGLQVE